MPSLRIQNLSKEFVNERSRISALHPLTLAVDDGELLAILGPSGSGKTTLLRLIAGLEKPDNGEISLGSENITHRKPQDRHIGMAFQYPALLPQLTVSENISLGLKLRAASATERSERTRELTELLQITDLLSRRPESLSGGQQQRVSLARALATRPNLLLLDEPLANLDPTSCFQLRDSIRTVQRKLCITTLYVTHHQDEATAVADRVAILNSGALQQIATASELYENPSNLFVAKFFAPEPPNILPGKIESKIFRADESNLAIPAGATHIGPAMCLIRPRSIRLGGNLTAEIQSIQQTGWSTSVQLNLQNTTLHALLPPTPNLQPGTNISISIDPAGALFFKPTGERLR